MKIDPNRKQTIKNRWNVLLGRKYIGLNVKIDELIKGSWVGGLYDSKVSQCACFFLCDKHTCRVVVSKDTV